MGKAFAIFAYGSLIGDYNGTSATLYGFRKTFDAEVRGKSYLNIREGFGSVSGTIIVTPQIGELMIREYGYDLVYVSDRIEPFVENCYAFVKKPSARKVIEKRYVDML